jgi:hypothetical protein
MLHTHNSCMQTLTNAKPRNLALGKLIATISQENIIALARNVLLGGTATMTMCANSTYQ